MQQSAGDNHGKSTKWAIAGHNHGKSTSRPIAGLNHEESIRHGPLPGITSAAICIYNVYNFINLCFAVNVLLFESMMSVV